MSRAIDEAYFKYSLYSVMESGMQVKCPKCQGIGMIGADDNKVYFKCTSCSHQKSYDRIIYRYDVNNKCINCGRYYRVDIELNTQGVHYSVPKQAYPEKMSKPTAPVQNKVLFRPEFQEYM